MSRGRAPTVTTTSQTPWPPRGSQLGALLTGLIADTFGILTAIWVVAALTAVSGLVVAVRIYETRKPHQSAPLQLTAPRMASAA
jgi:hypothetical protein